MLRSAVFFVTPNIHLPEEKIAIGLLVHDEANKSFKTKYSETKLRQIEPLLPRDGALFVQRNMERIELMCQQTNPLSYLNERELAYMFRHTHRMAFTVYENRYASMDDFDELFEAYVFNNKRINKIETLLNEV